MLFDFNQLSFSLLGLELTGIIALAIHLIIALCIVVLGFVLAAVCKSKLFPALQSLSEKKKQQAALIFIKGFTKPVCMSIRYCGILLALLYLPWAVTYAFMIQSVLLLCMRLLAVGALTAGLWCSAPITELLLSGASNRFDFQQNQTISMVFTKTYKTLVAVFGIISLMNEFNFEITGLITGLGLVGLTISLAAQDSASNLFAGFLILIERPFNIGDWISVNGIDGTVEDISFRSTKIRALDNSLYVLPNASVSSTTINNGTNREKRMYRFTLGVTYGTTRTQLEKLMLDLETMLKAHKDVDPNSAIVRLAGFGDSSIDLLVSCYVTLVDLPAFLSVQNELHLNIMDIMEANKTDFAFPSTTVYLENTTK